MPLLTICQMLSARFRSVTASPRTHGCNSIRLPDSLRNARHRSLSAARPPSSVTLQSFTSTSPRTRPNASSNHPRPCLLGFDQDATSRPTADRLVSAHRRKRFWKRPTLHNSRVRWPWFLHSPVPSKSPTPRGEGWGTERGGEVIFSLRRPLRRRRRCPALWGSERRRPRGPRPLFWRWRPCTFLRPTYGTP